MRRRFHRTLVIILALVLIVSMSPMDYGAGTLRIDSYRVLGSTVQVTVSNVSGAAQSGYLVVIAEIGSHTEIAVQPITIAAGGTVNKSTVFAANITRIISVGISEGPDPVISLGR